MDNALEKARAAYGTGACDDATLEFLFPQLKESEDERIRKEIISALKFANTSDGVYDKHIAWLEKQKEQRPAEINVKALLAADRLASAEMTGRLKERSEILENPEKYGLQKPTYWSEEDEKMLKEIELVVSGVGITVAGMRSKMLCWLKSIRPSWKPSEEQMKHLERCFSHGHTSPLPNQHVLESLYNDLKKLT